MFTSWFPTLRLIFGPWRASCAQRRTLLRLIATAAEQRVPLAPLLSAWAEEEWGRQRRRLARLASVLSEGAPIAAAIERTPELLSDEEVLLVRFGAESGSLAATLRTRLEDDHLRSLEFRNNVRRFWQYVLIFLLLGMPIAWFLHLKIAPEFARIFQDFGGVPPYAMQLARSVGAVAMWGWLAGAVVLLTAAWTRYVSWPARYFRRAVAPRVFAQVSRRRIGAVLQRLGEAASLGKPLPGAIATLARHHYDPTIRNKLLFARNELSLGAELWPTLRAAGLMNDTEVAAVESADRTNTRGWTLRTLGHVRVSRANRGAARATGLLAPTAVVALGAFVLVQAIGMFSALETLISMLA